MASFNALIGTFASDLNDGKYKTTSCLVSMIDKIGKLPKSVQYDHVRDIEKIVLTIQSFGDPQVQLTQNQIHTLLSLLTIELNGIPVKDNKIIEKFSREDVVIVTTLELLNNLIRNVMSISITNQILEYLDIIDMVMLEDNEKYCYIYGEIIRALQSQGWEIGHGFQREPNVKELILSLDKILIFHTA